MATHSSVLAWEIPWTEETGSYSPEGCSTVPISKPCELCFLLLLLVLLSFLACQLFLIGYWMFYLEKYVGMKFN